MSDLRMFALLEALSCIPWILSYRLKARDAQWGLLLIDIALTSAAWIYCYWAIGWWTILLLIGFAGLGMLAESAKWGKGYDNLLVK